jgi:hypothetical protein
MKKLLHGATDSAGTQAAAQGVTVVDAAVKVEAAAWQAKKRRQAGIVEQWQDSKGMSSQVCGSQGSTASHDRRLH